MDKITIIKNKMKNIEEDIISGKKLKEEEIDEIIGLSEAIEVKDFEINMLYAKAILLKNDEHSLDDAWWILSNMNEGKNNFECNYLLAKIGFKMEIYEEALKYIEEALKIDGNNEEAQKFYKKCLEYCGKDI
jgi:tetratricopeptide (TPR) repeat protein